MQPKIIKKDTLHITGLTGDGNKTGELWNDFDTQYKSAPFLKSDNCGYEIRFHDGKDIHVGFSETSPDKATSFTTITLSAAEYAVFDVYVAKGYDSGNDEVDRWLADNSTQFKQLQLNGKHFIIECYNEKFKGGDKQDSIVEMWIPLSRL